MDWGLAYFFLFPALCLLGCGALAVYVAEWRYKARQDRLDLLERIRDMEMRQRLTVWQETEQETMW